MHFLVHPHGQSILSNDDRGQYLIQNHQLHVWKQTIVRSQVWWGWIQFLQTSRQHCVHKCCFHTWVADKLAKHYMPHVGASQKHSCSQFHSYSLISTITLWCTAMQHFFEFQPCQRCIHTVCVLRAQFTRQSDSCSIFWPTCKVLCIV